MCEPSRALPRHEYVEGPDVHDRVFRDGQIREFLGLSDEGVDGRPSRREFGGNERASAR